MRDLELSDKQQNNINYSTIDNEYYSLIKENIEDKNKLYDQIFEEYGYGKEMWKIIIAVFLMYLVGSYATTTFSTMSLSYKEYFNLTENGIGFIGTILFISKAIGSLMTSFFDNIISRITITNISYILLIILTLFTGLINNYVFFIFTRIVFGLISGIFNVIANNILCEYLPLYLRSFFLNSVWAGFSFSQILNLVIMIFTMPEFEVVGIPATNYIYSIIIFISFILSLFLLEDSPRKLILNNNVEKGFEILYKFKPKEYFTNEIKSKISEEIRGGGNEKEENNNSKLFEIFNTNYLLFSFCVIFLNFGMNIFVDGGNLLTILVLNEVNVENKDENIIDIIKSNIIICTSNFLSNFFWAYLTEIRSLGRKNTICIGCITICISLFPVILFPSHITIFLTIFSFLTNTSILVTSYASEVYPTRIRDIGLGWIFSIGYIGSAIIQIVIIVLFKINWTVPYMFMMAISIICSFVICFSPIETYNRALDIKINENKKE